MMLGALISPGDHWAIWTILIATAAASIVLEQKNAIARKITGPVLALFGGMLLSNTSLMPSSSLSYDVIGEYMIPLVIPFLLLRMDIRRVIRETGRLFVVFHFSSLGTVVGTFIAVLLLGSLIPHLAGIGAAMSASYIGGAINFFAMVETFRPPKDLVGATIVADNGIMALYFLFLIALPGIRLVRRIFPESDVSRGFSEPGTDGGAEAYWKPKAISLRNIACSVALAFIITALSVKIAAYFAKPPMPALGIAGWFGESDMPKLIREVLGQKYLVLTTLSILFPLAFPEISESLMGSEELGTFLIYIFFVMIGIPASFYEVVIGAPLLLLFCAIILLFNFLLTVGLGKLFGYEIEEMILCAVVTSGGPMNGAAIAISKGWSRLVFPSVLAGIWGYIIGNYVGFACGKILIAWFGE